MDCSSRAMQKDVKYMKNEKQNVQGKEEEINAEEMFKNTDLQFG